MYRRRAATFLDDATLQLMHDCACFSIPIIWFWIQSPQVGQRGAYGVHDATGSRPMLSFTAFRSLNLFKFPSSFMAQTGTRAARVVRSNIVQTALRASGLNHAPDDFWAESVFSNPLGFVGGPKYRTCGDASSAQPGVDCRFHPSRHRNRPHVAALAHPMGDYPTLFSLLEAFERQSTYLCSSEAASQQDGNDSIISLAADTALVEPGKEALANVPLSASCLSACPCFFNPLTHRIPAARSGLRSPQSAASYASRRTAAKRRLIVEDA